MAYSYSVGTITGLDIRPGSYSMVPDAEDLGGDDEPVIRVANDYKHRFDVFIEPDANTTGPTLAQITAMAASKIEWDITLTDTTIGSSGAISGIIESVSIGGGSAMIATIVVAPIAA